MSSRRSSSGLAQRSVPWWWLLLLAIAMLPAARADAPSDATSDAREAEFQQAAAAAEAASVTGPQRIVLGEQATLNLPADYTYVPRKEGAALMHALGNRTDENFWGLVFGEHFEGGFVSIRFDPAGYIRDDDARDWNADELLQNLKDGTEAANEERRGRGIPEFVVSGWVERPAYDPASHRLVWSASLHNKQPVAGAVPGVNYNTYLLGRDGYFSMNLVTDQNHVEALKPAARQLLAALDFNPGKRYADFNASTDKVAAYGLAALVGGVALKKLGLLATLGVFAAKFWKLGVLAVFGAGAALRRLTARKSG